MELTTAQFDRTCGVLLATAVGDALGAGFTSGAWPTLQVQDALIKGWAPMASQVLGRRHGTRIHSSGMSR